MTSRTRALASAGSLLAALTVIGIYVKGADGEEPQTARVVRGPFTVTLTEAGVLRAADSATFRSPFDGRETEVTYLAPEGSEVQAGDLLVQLDASALKLELERATQAVRQVELELQAAEVDREEATLGVQAATHGAGALAVEEARTNHWLAQAKANRLQQEHSRLKPLLDKGYITRDEYDRSSLELDEALARAQLAGRGLDLLVERTRPAEEHAARLHLARRRAQVEHLRPKLATAIAHERSLMSAITASSIQAPRPGLVVYEDNLATMPRRKVRVGDRVTPSQGLVTLPDLRRLVVESSVREADIHLVRAGQPVTVRLDAFPELVLTGLVARLGTLAQSGTSGEPRFDLAIALAQAPSGLRPGMAARVDVAVAEAADALTAPLAAVFADGGAPVAYVIRGRTLERRLLRTGRANANEVEVLGGLREGERLSLAEPSGR